MAFDLEEWKTQLKDKLRGWKPRMQQAGINSIYGFLSAMTMWPVVQAYQGGDITALIALGGVLGGVGSNLVATQIQGWKDRSEAQAADALAEEAGRNAELREALDAAMEKLETISQAQAALEEADRAWFSQTLKEELKRMGSSLRMPVVSMRDGFYARGKNIIQLGKKAVLVQGSVKGDFVGPGGTLIKTTKSMRAARQGQEQALRHYLERLRRHCQALPLAALGGEEGAAEEITLDQVYIDLDTTTRLPLSEAEKIEPARHRFMGPGEEETKSLPAREAVRQETRLVLLGDPGAGKSTMINKLLAWQAAACLEEASPPPGCNRELLPILVLLRELAPSLAKLDLEALPADRRQSELARAVQGHLLEELKDNGEEEMAGRLRQKLEQGDCLLALDGLDETPQDLRRHVRQAAAAIIHEYSPQRVMVTCRARSYVGETTLPGFTSHTLAALDEGRIEKFVKAWYTAQHRLGRLERQAADRRAEDLAAAALSADLRELASNPLMLTAMAIIHRQEIGLPSERVRLYDRVVEILSRRWQKHKAGEQALAPSPELADFLKDDLRLRAALEHLAYEAHSAGQAEKPTDLLRGQALIFLEAGEHLGDPGLAGEFLDYVDQRAGLLAGRGGEMGHPNSYGFPHRTFQEYLAGCYLAGQRDLSRAYYAHAAQGDYWDLAARLGAEELYYNRRGANQMLDLAYRLCPASFPKGEQGQRALLWSGWMAALAGSETIRRDRKSPEGGQAFLERLLPRLVELLEVSRLPALERAEAGRALGLLGDPRPEATSVEGMKFCWIPDGVFLMGSKEEEWDSMGDDSPKHKVELPGFWMARHPVTNAQFQEFVRAGGYGEENYWSEAKRAGAWKKGRVIRTIYTEEGVETEPGDRPYDFGQPYDLPNHPVVGITWYEALAFSRWLEELGRRQGWIPEDGTATLPSEAEWEKSARGGLEMVSRPEMRFLSSGLKEYESSPRRENPAPKRSYPWDNEFDADNANTQETQLGSSSAVGCFPRGASPYGVLDLSGNVLEWTHSRFREYPYKPDDGREDMQTGKEEPCVMRGGYFLYSRRLARCAYRHGSSPGSWSMYFGFRVVVRFPGSSGL